MTWSIRLIQVPDGRLVLEVDPPPHQRQAVVESLSLMSLELASDMASAGGIDSSEPSSGTSTRKPARSDILRLARELEERKDDDAPPESN